jgi:hypothetical protein
MNCYYWLNDDCLKSFSAFRRFHLIRQRNKFLFFDGRKVIAMNI